MTTTLFSGGRILDQRGERSGDVLIDDETGTILEVGPGLNGDRRLDITGCVLAPGFVDLHVHLRQPGNEAAETVLRVTHQLHGATGFCDETTLSWVSRYSQPLRRLPFGLSATRDHLTLRLGRNGVTALFGDLGA